MLYRLRHIWNDYRPCLDRVSTHYRPTIDNYIDRLSTDCRPSIDRLSTEYRPTVDRLSTECRPLYRPTVDRLASPQTSFGVRLSRIHFSPRTSAKQSRLLRSPITGRFQIFVKRNPSRFLRFARSVRLLIECARNL